MRIERIAGRFRAWSAFAKMGMRRATSYPLDVTGHFISLLAYLAIHLLFLSNTGRDLTAGITVWIHACLFFTAVQLPGAGVFTGDIRSGRIILIETLPVSHFLRLHGQHIGQRLPSVIVVLLFFLVLNDVSELSLEQIVFLPSSLFLAFSFALLFDALIGLAAFSVPYVLGIGELKATAMLLFSGIIIPVPDLPWGLDAVAYLTPFPWLVHIPATALAEGQGMPGVIAVQLMWTVLLYAGFRILEARVRGRRETFGG